MIAAVRRLPIFARTIPRLCRAHERSDTRKYEHDSALPSAPVIRTACADAGALVICWHRPPDRTCACSIPPSPLIKIGLMACVTRWPGTCAVPHFRARNDSCSTIRSLSKPFTRWPRPPRICPTGMPRSLPVPTTRWRSAKRRWGAGDWATSLPQSCCDGRASGAEKSSWQPTDMAESISLSATGACVG